MRHGPTALLTTTLEGVTRILVRMDDDVVLKAALLPCYWARPPHRRALPSLLEAMALWHQAPVHAVVSARDVASWSALGLAEELDGGSRPRTTLSRCARRSVSAVSASAAWARSLTPSSSTWQVCDEDHAGDRG